MPVPNVNDQAPQDGWINLQTLPNSQMSHMQYQDETKGLSCPDGAERKPLQMCQAGIRSHTSDSSDTADWSRSQQNLWQAIVLKHPQGGTA